MSLNDLIRSSGLAVRDDNVSRTPDGTRVVYLHAGQLLVAPEPTQITTVLGSCVAICLWDSRLGIGGMNHFMLPMNPAAHERQERFADSATAALVDGLVSAGARLSRLEAKVFGGASVLGFGGSALGEKNIRAAQIELASRRIPIVAADVGGNHGRKVMFRTNNGFSTVKIV
jgi:chemotaxis protein CheD